MLKRLIISFFIFVVAIASLYSFSCFGIAEGFTIEDCKSKGYVFNKIILDSGEYVIWDVTPPPGLSSEFFPTYRIWIDNEYGLYKLQARSNFDYQFPWLNDLQSVLNKKYGRSDSVYQIRVWEWYKDGDHITLKSNKKDAVENLDYSLIANYQWIFLTYTGRIQGMIEKRETDDLISSTVF